MHAPISLMRSLIKWVKTKVTPKGVHDVRSRRFVAVIDCILNQNARDLGAARFPAMNFDFLQLCNDQNVGILQMPCPEIAALGFKRSRKPGQTIRDVLDTDAGRQRCIEIANDVVDRIEVYLAEGYELLAILGGNPLSPGCAVNDSGAGLLIDSGVFMKELQITLRERGLKACFRGIRDHDPELLKQDLQWFRELLVRKII